MEEKEEKVGIDDDSTVQEAQTSRKLIQPSDGNKRAGETAESGQRRAPSVAERKILGKSDERVLRKPSSGLGETNDESINQTARSSAFSGRKSSVFRAFAQGRKRSIEGSTLNEIRELTSKEKRELENRRSMVDFRKMNLIEAERIATLSGSSLGMGEGGYSSISSFSGVVMCVVGPVKGPAVRRSTVRGRLPIPSQRFTRAVAYLESDLIEEDIGLKDNGYELHHDIEKGVHTGGSQASFVESLDADASLTEKPPLEKYGTRNELHYTQFYVDDPIAAINAAADTVPMLEAFTRYRGGVVKSIDGEPGEVGSLACVYYYKIKPSSRPKKQFRRIKGLDQLEGSLSANQLSKIVELVEEQEEVYSQVVYRLVDVRKTRSLSRVIYEVLEGDSAGYMLAFQVIPLRRDGSGDLQVMQVISDVSIRFLSPIPFIIALWDSRVRKAIASATYCEMMLEAFLKDEELPEEKDLPSCFKLVSDHCRCWRPIL